MHYHQASCLSHTATHVPSLVLLFPNVICSSLYTCGKGLHDWDNSLSPLSFPRPSPYFPSPLSEVVAYDRHQCLHRLALKHMMEFIFCIRQNSVTDVRACILTYL